MTFVEQFDAIFDSARLDIADEILAPEFIGHLPLASALDREGWKAYVSAFYAAVPNLWQEINEVILGENWLVLRVTYFGTHSGPFLGIPATGTPVTMEGIGIFRFNESGLAAELWAVMDIIGLLSQLGRFPRSTGRSP